MRDPPPHPEPVLQPASASAGQSGFTLVELLASLSILAVLLGLVALALDVVGRGWDRAAVLVSDRDMIARGSDAIRSDLSRVLRPVALAGQRPVFLFDGGESEVRFVAVEPPYPTEPGPHLIQLAVRRSGDVTRLVRARLPWHPKLSLNPADPFREEVTVLEGAFDLRFGYLDSDGGAGRWLDRWPHQDRMPRLMRLEILSRADRSALVPAMVVALAVDAEHGCTGGPQEPCSPRTGGVLRQGEAQRPPPGTPKGDGQTAPPGTPPGPKAPDEQEGAQ